MTQRARWISSLVLAMGLAGCSAYEGEPASYGDPGTDAEGGSMGTPGPTPGVVDTDTGSEATGAPSRPGSGVTAGVLTAGAWDDNRNLAHYEKFLADLAEAERAATPQFSDGERAASAEAFAGDRAAKQRLDVALLIDTTGSMGDEMSYLSAEFMAIAGRVNADYPGADTRWALVLYRDEGDEYVVRTFDFIADEATFRANLGAQSANGGGDYPEASHAGLSATTNLAWREDADVARLAFWVADAPHHEAVTDEVAASIRTARDLDVHLYPVASSGVDRITEASMRAAAQITGGRYLFLTDDSGVGGSHLEPSLPCYFVTLLADAITRMVDIEMTGVYHEPASDEIIRTGGDPEAGACTLESGDTVLIF